jgi:hypothetical protein
MAQQYDDGPQHEIPGDGDPLLVRPFLDDDPAGTPASKARWPAQKYRTLRSHRAGAAGGSVPPILEPAESEGAWSPDGPGQGRRRLRLPAETPHPDQSAQSAHLAQAAGMPAAPVAAGGSSAQPWPDQSAQPWPDGNAQPWPGNPQPWTGGNAPPRSAWTAQPGTGADPPTGITGEALARPRAAAEGNGEPPAGDGERRRRSYALAGAGAAAVIGLAALGYGLVPPPTENEASLPSGALPPLAPAPAVTGPGGASVPPDPGTATATGTTGTTGPAGAGATGPAAAGGGITPPAGGAATGGGTPAPAAPTDATTGPPPPHLIAPLPEETLSPAPEVARVGTIAADSNLCLDVNGGVPADNNHVQVFDCNGTSAQRWTMSPDGTLQVVGKCAQVTGDATVHIIGCDSRDEAQWRAGPEDSLVNLATNECLTDPASGDRSGVVVTVDTCTGSDNQQWDLP